MPRIKKGTVWAEPDYTLRAPWTFKTKEKVICVCEGGGFCDREDPSRQRGLGNAIPGLHSSWVGADRAVLAMARPWQAHIHQHNLIDAFVQNKIGMILNLQEVGEHASCGPGLLPHSGFTYSPETFMAAKVAVYNINWRDMGVPDLQKMMNIVQVMDYVVNTEGRRVAVHCHAGLGRTGLAIACFLVYSRHYSAQRAVEEVRRDRPGALQTRRQVLFVYVFEQYCAYLRCVHPPSAAPSTPNSTSESAVITINDTQDTTPQPPAASTSPSSQSSQSREDTSIAEGLLVVRGVAESAMAPNQRPKIDQGDPNSDNKDTLSAKDLGLVRPLPWTAGFDIVPEEYDKAWLPHAPLTYKSALNRQQRLLHGPERRMYLHVHKYLAELVMALIHTAQTHTQHTGAVAATAAQPQQLAGGGAGMAAHTTGGAGGVLQTRVSAQAQHSQPPASPQQQATSQRTSPARHSPQQQQGQPVAESTITQHPPNHHYHTAHNTPHHHTGYTSLYIGSGQSSSSDDECEASTSGRETDRSSINSNGRNGRGGSGWKGMVRWWKRQRRHGSSTAGPVAESAAGPPQPPAAAVAAPAATYADALLRCVDAAMRTKPGALDALGRQPGYGHFTGSVQGGWSGVCASADKLQQCANMGDHTSLCDAPVAVLAVLIERLMSHWTQRVPALSEATLRLARDHYQDFPYDVSSSVPEPSQFLAAAQLLDPLPPSDQELLLLFSALLRHTVRASGGAGCEEAVKGVCAWVVRVLVGGQMNGAPPVAMEAMTGLFWWLIRNDVAYATLILAKHRRLHGGSRKKLSDTVGHKRTSKRSSRNKIVPETALPHHPLQPHGGAYAGRENAISVTSLDHVPLGPTAQPHVLAHSGKHDPNVHRSEASTAATLAYGMGDGVVLPPGVIAPPPASPPPPVALAPAHAGPACILAAPTPTGRAGGLAPLPDVHGIARVESRDLSPARPLRARGAEGQGVAEGVLLTPYGNNGYNVNRQSGRLTPLRSQLQLAPTVYIPPTCPGTQQIAIHDVWV